MLLPHELQGCHLPCVAFAFSRTILYNLECESYSAPECVLLLQRRLCSTIHKYLTQAIRLCASNDDANSPAS